MSIRNALQCPDCKQPIHVSGRYFACPNHGAIEATDDGILLFRQKPDAYFEAHWEDNLLEDVPVAKMDVARDFLAPLLNRGKLGSDSRYLDVGTGDGIHLSLLADLTAVECAGIDVSLPALRTASRRTQTSLLMLAGAEAIPLQDESVDAAFAYGVLAYTNDVWSGMAEMVRVTRRGGLIGVWFYPPSTGLAGIALKLVRGVVPRLPRVLQRIAADLIVPLLGILPTSSNVSLRNASWDACREVVLVNIAAPKIHFPSSGEIESRLEALGCKVLLNDRERPISIWVERQIG